MELLLLPRKVEPQVHSPEVAAKVLSARSSPEPEVQRGRKRRRDPVAFALIAAGASQTPSGETFRGRCRQRSTSLVNLTPSSRNASSRGCLRDASYSPSRKRFFRAANNLERRRGARRRSQSPSRSRSPDDREGGGVKRRRQRTASHSRDHHHHHHHHHHHQQGVVSFALVEQAQQSPLRLEFTTGPEVSRDEGQDG